MPCSSNEENSSPYKIRYGRNPDIRHFQPWGITAYVRRTLPQPKILPRADAGILVGYDHEVTGQKGWRIELSALRKIVTSTSISFDVSLEDSIQRRGVANQSTTLPQLENYGAVITQPVTASPLLPPADTSGSVVASAPSRPTARPPSICVSRSNHPS